MFLARIIRFSLWPLKAASRLPRSIKRGARAGRSAEQAAAQLATVSTTGVLARTSVPQDELDVRHGVLFKVFDCPDSDEPTVDPNDLEGAARMADRAREFYGLRADLFPPDDIFYEQVEGALIDRVGRIDNGGDKDQFVATLDQARRLTNDNTRKLLCELGPGVLIAMLLAYAGTLLFLALSGVPQSAGDHLSAEGVRLAGGAIILAVALGALGFVYLFSYSHIQRENALNLNAFITTEFAHLNNAFRVAQREALQAETQLADSQKEQIKSLASSWTLAYHWIGMRQFFAEMFVRNIMFQIRRNTSLYATLGVLMCFGAFLAIALLASIAAGVAGTAGAGWVLAGHLLLLAGGFTIVSYGLIMRRPFAIVVSALLKDQWYRYDTLAVGAAISEQVTRDKVQIVINRDRARASGV